MANDGRLRGKAALVTGGAAGMGRATCVRLTSEACRVFALDINSSGLEETAAIVKEAGGTIETRVCDVSSRSECFEAVEACVATFGQLDILANIAGVLRLVHSLEMSEDDWNLVLGVNLSGPFFLSQAALPHLLETRGNIINIASNAGLMGQAYTVAYSTTNGAVVNMTRALAMEFAKEPVRINAVAPGGVVPSMTRNYSMPDDVDFSLVRPYMGFREMADPAELANVIAFVASDEASRMHGAIVSVDGGLTAG